MKGLLLLIVLVCAFCFTPSVDAAFSNAADTVIVLPVDLGGDLPPSAERHDAVLDEFAAFRPLRAIGRGLRGAVRGLGRGVGRAFGSGRSC